jgi:hypothetical protein
LIKLNNANAHLDFPFSKLSSVPPTFTFTFFFGSPIFNYSSKTLALPLLFSLYFKFLSFIPLTLTEVTSTSGTTPN